MNSSKIFLVQTDTTVGFLSSSELKLSKIKKRNSSKKTLQVVDSLKSLSEQTRVPKKFKNKIRKAKNHTFIFPNSYAFRVVDKNSHHYNFIKKFSKLYSTSANLTNNSFDETFARSNAQIVVENKDGFFEAPSSKLLKISKRKIKKIR